MPLASDLQAAIAAAGGTIRFDEFMQVALYGAQGFYTSGRGAGRRGDFITSPEVGPLFGAVLARWIEAEWQRLGEPAGFTVVECGAGPGTLARSVLAAAPHWRGRYVAVEVSAEQRRRHPDGVVSVDEMPPGMLTGVVIANELLDNIPFRLAVFDGGWREAAITTAPGGSLVECTLPADPSWDWLPSPVPLGTRVPIQSRAASWVTSCRTTLCQGTVIAFDYCTPTTSALAGRPWREWLRTYRDHGRGDHYLTNPGGQDVTAQVCVDQLPAPATIELQASFLRRWGIDDLVDEGRVAWSAAAARPDVAALTMRSRAREADALTAVDGLGAFHVLSWGPLEAALP